MTAPGSSGYVPDFMIDEVSPRARATPAGWLCRDENGWFMQADDDGGASDARRLAGGEVIEFCRVEVWPNVTVRVTDNGPEIIAGAVAAEADTFWVVGEFETVSSTLGYCVLECEDGDEVDVSQCRWLPELLVLRTALTADGVMTLEPAESAPEGDA